ncbi:TfoX/Sxy family protein [Paenibacillus chartarius]|uniref:TfoX/Sxy family protein n=1 Tax=Paenibacillus chartarius TaxID=747481 RepID=A0ABV6DFN0_9BACL
MPKMDESSKALFAAVMPLDPRVTVKPMFGALAGFINGNMFTGLVGTSIYVRLPEARREEMLSRGASEFAPMPGRAMKEYVVVPEAWRDEPEKIGELVAESLAWAETLPEKLPAKKKSKPAPAQ